VPSPQDAVERFSAGSAEARAAVLLDEHGELAASTGADEDAAKLLRETAQGLLEAADRAGSRAGLPEVARVEVSRPDGGVFALRDGDASSRRWTLLAVTAGATLPALVLYDMRMAIRAIGAPA
jgi:hypothetical protein